MNSDIHVGVLVALGFSIVTALVVIACMFQFSSESSASQYWLFAPTGLCAELLVILARLANRKDT
jgi:hypothetical protein